MRRIHVLCTKFDELVPLHHPPVSICSHLLPITPTLQSRNLFQFVFLPRSFLTAAPRGMTRKRSSRLARSSGRRRRYRPVAAWAPRRVGRPLNAVFAATGNIWPQRRCKAWASAAREWEGEASVLLRATARRNVWVAVLQRPPTSSARTTSLQRPCCPNSGQVFQFGRPIHCWTSQNPLPKGHQTLFQRSRSRSSFRAQAQMWE